MKKTTFTDLKQNRTLKTKRWLGWLMFCMMLLYGQIGVAQIDYSYDWEDSGMGGWTSSGSGSFVRSTTTPCTGNASARANNYYANESYLISPALTGTNGGDITVEFDYKVTGYYNNSSGASEANFGEIRIEWSHSADGPWVVAHTITNTEHVVSGSCANKSYTFSEVPGSGNIYIRFVAKSGNDDADNYVYFDNVDITQGLPPSCLIPGGLTVSNTTESSTELNWISDGSTFEVSWGEGSFDVEDGTIVPFVNGATLSGLDADTDYSFYVRQDCGDDGVSAWGGPYNFYTGYCVSTGTSNSYRINGVSTTGGYTNIDNMSNGTSAGYSNYSMMSVSQSPGGTIDYTINVPSSTGIKIWIDLNNDFVFDSTELVASHLTYMTAGNWTGSITVPADLAVGDYRVRIRSQYYSYTFEPCGAAQYNYGEVEDYTLSVIPMPTCLPPTALTVADVTATAATLGWTGAGSLFDVEILEEGETPTGEPTYEGVTNNFTTTTPLTGSTTYNYWVRQDCGNDDLSLWAGPYSFTTLCVPVSTLPYIESFDAYGTSSGAFPLCWERPVVYGTTPFPSIVSQTNAPSSPGVLRFQSDIGTPTYAVSPAFAEDINNLRVTFQLRKEGNSSGTMDVGVMSDAGDVDTFELIETIDPGADYTYNEYVIYLDDVSLSGANNHIAFRYNAGTSAAWYYFIDDFVVEEIPSCFPPSDIEVDNITTYSAELTWVAPTMGNPATDGYVIELRTSGAPGETPGLVDTVNTTDLSATLSGLEPSTSYTVYIKSLCTEDTDESIWESISFVTACELPDAPENITFTDITATATKVNYEAPATAPTGYVIFRSTSDVPPVLVNGTNYPANNSTAIASLTDGDNTYFSVYNGTDLVGNATSLTSNTEYYYYVFSRSAENDCFGAPWYSTTALTDNEVTAPATPTAAVVSNHADTSATISWTASNVGGEVGAITYTLEVYTDSEYENPITGSPFEMGADVSQDLTGLAVSTQYFFRIKANNTYHDSEYLTGNFTTTQVPATLNYEQDFEVTHGWAFTNNDSHENNWYVDNATGNPGSSLYVSKDGGVSNEYNTSGTRVVHAYRDIAVPAGTSDATISFDWKGQGETVSWDYFRVWLVPASYLPTAGTQISSGSDRIQLGGNFNGESDWQQYENANVDLSSFAGQTMRLVFEWKNDGSSGSGDAAAIDNIEITIPDCSKPLELTVENVTDESTDLSWTSIGDTFDIKWGAPDFDVETEGTLVEGFENGGTLSALDADTAYEYYVRQDCGVDGTSAWAGPYSFRTAQIPATLDYEQNFDGTHSWTLINGTQTNQWVVSDAVGNTGSSLYISNDDGVTNAYTTSSAASTVQAYRDIQIPEDAEMISFSFDWKSGGESIHDYFRVWVVSTDYNPTPGTQISTANSGGVQIGDLFNLQSDWTNERFEIPVEDYAGEVVRLVFEWRNDGSSGTQPAAAIDNIDVSLITCFPPLNLEVGSITKNSAEATWETPALGNTPEDGYVVEIRTENEEDEEVVIDTIETTDLSATLSGLEASTTYTIYIKSLCTEDTDESFWSEGVTFTTLCDYPDFELVNSEEDLILCGPNTIELEVASDGIINWYDAADATEPIFTGTTFETDELTETTSFWVETIGDLTTGVGARLAPESYSHTTSSNYGLTFHASKSFILNTVDVYLAGSAGDIVINLTNESGEVLDTRTLNLPVGNSSNPILHTLALDFNIAEQGVYNLIAVSSPSLVRESSLGGFPYAVGDVASITQGYPSGILAASYYYFYNWNYSSACISPREEVVVTVTPVIDVVTAEIIAITGPTATLEITAEADATEFDIEYGETGYTQGDTSATLVTAQESPYTIEGLTEGDEYDVYVRVTGTCGEWFGPITFTAVEPSDPQVITAEDITKVYGDEPFVNGESDSGLALTYEVADQTVATFVGGQLVIQGAGETEVTAKQAGNADYLPAEDVTFTLTVTKADLTVTADDQTKVYDGEVFEDWTVIYEGFVYEDQASDLSGELVYEGDAATAINAGTYTIEVSGLLSDNYTINYEEGSLIITKATLEGITFEDQTVTYDGEEKSIFITGDLPVGVTVTYTGNEQTEVGDYEVTAHIDGGTNFEDMELEAVMSIRGVLTDITFEDAEFTYDGTAKSIFITGDLPEGVTVTYTGNAQTEAGEYEVVANIEGGEFYSDLELTATLTINKATISGIVFTDAEFVYNCTAHSLAITGELPEGVTVSYENNGNVESGTYTVTANINGGENYEDLTLTAVMTIEELLPTIADQFSCGALLVVDVETNLPSGWETKWYAGATSTDAIETILTSGVYYVSSSYNDCESSRIEVQVTIEDVSIPTGNAQQQFCISGQVSDLVVEHTTGTTLQVYETPTGGVALNANYSLYNGTFYVSEKIGDCESARLAIQVTITPAVPALSPAEFVICGHQLLSTIELDNLPNAELVWYANATTPQAMSASVQITSGTFYVSQKIGICESLRVPIVFEVQQVLPQPTATSIQQFCISAIVSELVATGAPNALFKWYASATSATPLESTAALQNGTYYVSQELNGCESARRAVSVIITNLTAPQATSFEFCGSATVADFSMPVISGVTYNWYLPNQSTPLPSTHVLTNGNYLVKKAQNGCESNSAIVQVTIKPIPNSPTGQLEQEFIDSAMISDLEMDQPGVVWYITYEDALNGNNPLQANMPLQDGNVYYGVLIGANGCPSLPVAVTVTITLGVKDLDLASLKYYPNPVETELTVSYKAPINSLEVFDLTGKLIKAQTYDSNNVRLDVSSLSAGTYMIKVHTSVGSQFIKIVKK